jgi:predicted NACHT family NTPase
MYSGSLIDELITTVERAEESALEETYIHDERVAYWYSVAQQELAQFDSGLAGVA